MKKNLLLMLVLGAVSSLILCVFTIVYYMDILTVDAENTVLVLMALFSFLTFLTSIVGCFLVIRELKNA